MMRRLASITALAVILPCVSVGGRTATDDPFKNLDCKTAKVQMEMNYCADRDFKSADRKLNTVYRRLLGASDSKEQALLKAAERDWIAYRDSECALETAGSMGGSMHLTEFSVCLTQKTEAHMKDLEELGD